MEYQCYLNSNLKNDDDYYVTNDSSNHPHFLAKKREKSNGKIFKVISNHLLVSTTMTLIASLMAIQSVMLLRNSFELVSTSPMN